jgi:hypothetical protein
VLVIRKDQLETIRQTAGLRFEDEMIVHLGDFSPALVRTVDEDHLRKAIRLGIAHAAVYGLTHRGPVRLYLELMLLFGSHFDTDPQYPWTAEILTNPHSASQIELAEQLYQRTLVYCESVAGPENAYALKALRNISFLTQQPPEVSRENFVADMLQEIASVYPQKAAYVGQAGLEALIREGMEQARRLNFPTLRGYALIVWLMLFFGHGCGEDPFYPWITRTFQDNTITDSAARAQRLEAKAFTWLTHVLANFADGVAK